MDFFASQELARRNTRKLVVLLALTVFCITLAIYGLIVGIFYAGGGQQQLRMEDAGNWFTSLQNFELFGGVLAGVSAVVGFGSLYKISELNAGGKVVAEMLGGRRLLTNSTDLAERRLLNIVEEMALASGVAVPPVYVLDGEMGINAFAAGHTIDDCVIGVNRGTLEQLNRDELQGVIAHEFSHILNGDMRMSLRMIGLLHGILIIALIGYQIIRAVGNTRSSSNKEDKGGGAVALLLLGAGLVAIGGIGLLFSKLIKASVSRQREYLADASAVQFTRNPEGIAGALKMIGAAQASSRVQQENAESISHMFFANMHGSGFAGLFSTHPPLIKRIQKIDSRFTGDFAEYLRTRSKASVLEDRREEKRERKRSSLDRFGFPGMGLPGASLPGASGAVAGGSGLNPAILVSAVGDPTDDDVVYSRALMGNIPDSLQEAIRDVFLARCVVFGWLLDEQPEIRQHQLQLIRQHSSDATAEYAERFSSQIQSAGIEYRLPISEILQGTLVAMSEKQYRTFRSTVVHLINADREVDLFEFFIQHHLLDHLNRHFGIGLPHRILYETLDKLQDECAVLLAVLAEFGHDEEAAASVAFAAAWNSLPGGFGTRPYPSSGWDYPRLANAVKRLSHASPTARKQLLSAAAISISHDSTISPAEAELYRALGESLDCPVPPILAGR